MVLRSLLQRRKKRSSEKATADKIKHCNKHKRRNMDDILLYCRILKRFYFIFYFTYLFLCVCSTVYPYTLTKFLASTKNQSRVVLSETSRLLLLENPGVAILLLG